MMVKPCLALLPRVGSQIPPRLLRPGASIVTPFAPPCVQPIFRIDRSLYLIAPPLYLIAPHLLSHCPSNENEDNRKNLKLSDFPKFNASQLIFCTLTIIYFLSFHPFFAMRDNMIFY